MFSKILTFSVLSVFCVLTAISSVYAHTPTNPSYTSSLRHLHGGGWHTHPNLLHFEKGKLHSPCATKDMNENCVPGLVGTAHTHEHYHPDYNFDTHHDMWEPIWDSPPADDPPPGNPPTSHSHSITHSHGSYVSHTHTGTHTGDASEQHSQSEILSLSGNNHAGVGIRQQNTPQDNPPPGPPEGETEEEGVGPPPDNNNQGEPTEETSNGGTTTPVAEESGTPQEASSSQPVTPVVTSSAPQEPPQERPPEPPPLQPLRVTEYMVRDWSAGRRGLPQWIELHNPNAEAVNLKGYTFQYATRRFANHPYKIHTLTLAATEDEEFSIPSGGVALLATQRLPEDQRFPARQFSFSGIEATQVYALGIENVLKRGWVLTDADGAEVHRLGRDAFDALGDPVAPPHKERVRVSYHAYKSESPSEPYYYGYSEDIGSPGFYEEPAPAAPSAVKRKRVGTWASLKQTP